MFEARHADQQCRSLHAETAGHRGRLRALLSGELPVSLAAHAFPGFGDSDLPDPTKFAYTFDSLADVIGRLLEEKGFISLAFGLAARRS